MFANPSHILTTVLRIAIFSTIFIGPVAGFAATQSGPGASVNGAGLVLFVSLQRAR